MDADAFWIIFCGALVAASCSLLGCFLVLRRMAMVGDAISHSILPGIVIAFFLTGTRDSLPMLVGAGVLGLATTMLIEFLHRVARVQSDAAIGITFTSLFAIGVILIALLADQVDLDQDCVLYGEIAYVPLDTIVTEAGTDLGPRVAWIAGAVLLLVAGAVFLFYKQLLLTSFDPAFAAAVGLSTSVWHYALMGLVSLTTVASFEAVGAILVVALMIAPPATAYLLTQKLVPMLLTSVGLGVAAAVGGYYLAEWLDSSIAGAMATVAGGQFGVALVAHLGRGPKNLARQSLAGSDLGPAQK
jgi:manganese/zinc/iron transport system permease protein